MDRRVMQLVPETRRVAMAARRRLFLGEFLRRLGPLLAGAAGAVVLAAVASKVWPGLLPDGARGLVWLGGVAGGLSCLMLGIAWHAAARRWRSTDSITLAAARVDGVLGLRDALSAALDVAGQDSTGKGSTHLSSFETLAVERAEALAPRVSAKVATPVRWPPLLALGPLLLSIAAGVWFLAPARARAIDPMIAAKEQAKAETTRAASQLTRTAESLTASVQSPEAKRIVERESQRAAEIERELREGTRDATEARSQAARSLTRAADSLEQRAAEQARAADEVAARLANAAQDSSTEADRSALSEALSRGDLEHAAEILDRVRDGVDRLSPAERERLSRDLESLSERLRDQPTGEPARDTAGNSADRHDATPTESPERGSNDAAVRDQSNGEGASIEARPPDSTETPSARRDREAIAEAAERAAKSLKRDSTTTPLTGEPNEKSVTGETSSSEKPQANENSSPTQTPNPATSTNDTPGSRPSDQSKNNGSKGENGSPTTHETPSNVQRPTDQNATCQKSNDTNAIGTKSEGAKSEGEKPEKTKPGDTGSTPSKGDSDHGTPGEPGTSEKPSSSRTTTPREPGTEKNSESGKREGTPTPPGTNQKSQSGENNSTGNTATETGSTPMAEPGTSTNPDPNNPGSEQPKGSSADRQSSQGQTRPGTKPDSTPGHTSPHETGYHPNDTPSGIRDASPDAPTGDRPSSPESGDTKGVPKETGLPSSHKEDSKATGKEPPLDTPRSDGKPAESPRESGDSSTKPDGAPGDSQEPRAPKSLEELSESLRRVARRSSDQTKAREDAEKMREAARELLRDATPEQRQQMEDLARQISKSQGRDGQDAAPFPSGEGSNSSAQDDPSSSGYSNASRETPGARSTSPLPSPAQRPGTGDTPIRMTANTDRPGETTQDIDARRPGDGAGTERVLAEWFDKTPQNSGSAPGGTPPAAQMKRAAEGAEKSIESKAVPPRYADLVRRVFQRYVERGQSGAVNSRGGSSPEGSSEGAPKGGTSTP